MGLALRRVCDDDFDSEGICLARAAKIIRRDMFELQGKFTGSFDKDCQMQSVPHSLLALVGMIQDGPSIKSPRLDTVPQTTLCVAQLMRYNSSVRRRAGSTGAHHNKTRETPIPIFVGLTVHARTRKRDLVDTLFDLGLSISYDRVLEISTAMNNYVCKQYNRDGVVCPLNLHQGLPTSGAIDNIDHNPSSTTASGSFHGTGISLFQHPSQDNHGHDRREHGILEQSTTAKMMLQLPESYTNVPPLVLTKKDVPIPSADTPFPNDFQVFSQALHKEIG